jgi:hypothetical protein
MHAKQPGNNLGNEKSTEIAGVENEDLACWSAGAKPALANFGGSAFRLLQVSYSVS